MSYIRSVQFRYVPNHIRPADFINSEIQLLRSKMLANLRQTKVFKEGNVQEAMERLNQVAATMLQATSDAVAAGSGGRGLSAAVPADFAELAFEVALQTVTKDGLQPTELQGSGTQSFTLLHVLDLLDRSGASRGFGWKRANVWALEEPESFLHAGLRSTFAADLHAFANDDRRQVFATTHQDEFVRVGECAWIAAMKDGETSASRMISREALQETTRLRITTFQHPLMESADQPLVLVEGPWDFVHLRAALAELGTRPRWRLACLDDIDALSKGGGDNLLAYLKQNQLVLRSRAETAPVVVLRDWEDGGGPIDKYSQAVSVHEHSKAICCPEDLVNAELGRSFRGIERYLPTDLILEALPDVAVARTGADGSGVYVLVDKSAWTSAKKASALAVKAGASPGPQMRLLATWIDDEVKAALEAVPVQSFL
jgi:hypothetical protein